jgi:hypothetical protein
MWRVAVIAGFALLCGACGGAARGSAPTTSEPAAVATCASEPLSAAPFPGETGVYRAGGLTIVVGEDLAQVTRSRLAGTSGSEAIAVAIGNRPVVLSVDAASRARFSLQFTPVRFGSAVPQIADGRPVVRFAACGQAVHRFGGGVLFAGPGCARLHAREAGRPVLTMLIPIGNTLRGCPRPQVTAQLRLAAPPRLGVACPRANSIACDRVGIGVRLDRAAALVVVEVAGRLVTLSPPDALTRNALWLGYLHPAGLRHRGPLRVRWPRGATLWSGRHAVRARVRVTAFLADGTTASLTSTVSLNTGFG